MPKKPLCVAFLWHMHQPDYRDRTDRRNYSFRGPGFMRSRTTMTWAP